VAADGRRLGGSRCSSSAFDWSPQCPCEPRTRRGRGANCTSSQLAGWRPPAQHDPQQRLQGRLGPAMRRACTSRLWSRRPHSRVTQPEPAYGRQTRAMPRAGLLQRQLQCGMQALPRAFASGAACAGDPHTLAPPAGGSSGGGGGSAQSSAASAQPSRLSRAPSAQAPDSRRRKV
jgi:hypothetical protein